MTDSTSAIFQIIAGSLMGVLGIRGVLKGELRFRLRFGGGEIVLTGKGGIASSLSLIAGGALLIISTRPIDSGFHQIIAVVGCALPIIVVSFSYVMQSLIRSGRAYYANKGKSDHDELTRGT